MLEHYGVRNRRIIWGQNIRKARIAAGLTQVQLAGILGTTQQAIAAWENGLTTPKDDNRFALADATGTPYLEMFKDPRDDESGPVACGPVT